MLFHDGNEGKYQTDVLAAAETTIQTAMKHREMRPEFNQCLGQTRRGGYCVLCGRHFVPVTKKRICLHCKEELEEWHREVYTELFCYDCGKPYSSTEHSGPKAHQSMNKPVNNQKA